MSKRSRPFLSVSTCRDDHPSKDSPAKVSSISPPSGSEITRRLKHAFNINWNNVSGANAALSVVPHKKQHPDARRVENRPSECDVPSVRQRTLSSSSEATIRVSGPRKARRKLGTKAAKGNSVSSTTPKSSPKNVKASPRASKSSPTTPKSPPRSSKSPPKEFLKPHKPSRHKRQHSISFGALNSEQDENEEEDIAAITNRLLAVAPAAALAITPPLSTHFPGNEDNIYDTSFLDLSLDLPPSPEPPKPTVDSPRCQRPVVSNYIGYSIAQGTKDGLWPSGDHTDASDTVTPYGHSDIIFRIRLYEDHVTLWDAPQGTSYALPVQLLLKCVQSENRVFDPRAIPDIFWIELKCCAVPPRHIPDQPNGRSLMFVTCYRGATIARFTANFGTPPLDVQRGIHIEQVWHPTMDRDGEWGWYARAWIPLRMELFDIAETRTLRLEARVWIDEDDKQKQPFEAGAELTVSHLLKSRMMV
ncbi:hypothetical protein BJ138DRAFT_1150185 [Hygrophoropsis aurantiaca]|uniref:Uncharacterized protein n=1 Tax=Hygrophoropsis aurantiaca TaxID=72124 RepID=A0ACB8AEN5_9AGAM|nr:hypothetical protein BJ138DRAFT_1150185 [Hygrophoropsis aurantiaca]